MFNLKAINLKAIFKPFLRSGAHAGADIVIDNTIGAYVKQTPTKADDAALENFIKPEAHKFIDIAFNGFKDINIKYYFIGIWSKILTSICNIELLNALEADIQARKAQIKEEENHTWIERPKDNK